MPKLNPMPPVAASQAELARIGQIWTSSGGRLEAVPAGRLTHLFVEAIGAALAEMLGGIPVVKPNANALSSAQPDCVEVGPVRIIGGVRPQNFDVGYRPDGIRFALDHKTLNDRASVGKNWQNMINDLATEATTVHSRFPHAVVAFFVAVPSPCFTDAAPRAAAKAAARRSAIIETLERLARRVGVADPDYMAEAIAFVLWNPADGSIDPDYPDPSSPLRIEKFHQQVEAVYRNRYKGLPPHAE